MSKLFKIVAKRKKTGKSETYYVFSDTEEYAKELVVKNEFLDVDQDSLTVSII